jgi:hypothetical protein
MHKVSLGLHVLVSNTVLLIYLLQFHF